MKKPMQKIVADFQEYVRTYSDQKCYADYAYSTFIDDMLYGIGIAVGGRKYRFADGFSKWCREISRHATEAARWRYFQPDMSRCRCMWE